MSQRIVLPVFLALATGLAASSSLLALDATWTGAVSSDYADAANWGAPGNVVPAVPGTAFFATAGNGNTTLANTTTSLNQITFTSAAAAYTLGNTVGGNAITLSNSNSGGKINVTADVVNNQSINSDIVLGTSGAASGGYQFNNASTGGATLTLAGNVTGGSGGTPGAKTLTLLGGGAGTVGGAISNGGATSLTVIVSAGTWTLSSNASTFSGATITQDAITYTRAVQLIAATLVIGADNAIGNGVLNITNNSAVVQAGGGDRALTQSIVLGNNGFTLSGSNSVATTGKLVFGGASTVTNNISGAGKTFTVGDNIEIRNAASSFTRTITFNGSGTTVLNGPIVNYNPSVTSSSIGTLAYTGTGTLKSTGTNTYTGITSISAGGTYLVNGSHSVATVGTYTVNGTLGGTGTIAPSGVNTVEVGATGILSPGDSTLGVASQTGALEVGNTINLASGSSVAMQLGGSTPGDGQGFYDQVNMTNASGAVNLNGLVSLTLTLVNGFVPSGGNVFYLVTRADGGEFLTLFDGTTEGGTVDFGGGVTGQITYLADWTGTQAGSSLTGGNDIAVYNIVAVPEPGVAALAALGLGLLLLGRRRFSRPSISRSARSANLLTPPL
jgi:hypothetical protein